MTSNVCCEEMYISYVKKTQQGVKTIFIIILLNTDTSTFVQECVSFSSHGFFPHNTELKCYQGPSATVLSCLLISLSSFRDLFFF